MRDPLTGTYERSPNQPGDETKAFAFLLDPWHPFASPSSMSNAKNETSGKTCNYLTSVGPWDSWEGVALHAEPGLSAFARRVLQGWSCLQHQWEDILRVETHPWKKREQHEYQTPTQTSKLKCLHEPSCRQGGHGLVECMHLATIQAHLLQMSKSNVSITFILRVRVNWIK